ncbi:NADP-dependent succinic semialdehyde dehydrogenase [Mycobacterium paraintracellulare]|uniref:NADP-dependent succinic semialdehyde dehydrogenase n=1 Tax=Mycobacterium paraintracellulare TaxID=1138383 RepID=UPI001925673E|nr:NADP-dependent succinic semialdehyde dehydrogenase [Mycobacterium paraintracellulare]BCP14091.1 succinate-semialdehyde dehydrogenase [NADP(+)] 1 [Mycobacterium paraintracellulare]
MAIASINPATGYTVETFAPHDSVEVQHRIAQAAEAHSTLRQTTYAERAQWMCTVADILEADVDKAAALITLEMGKPIAQSRAEVLKCAKSLRFYAENAESFLAADSLTNPSVVAASSAGTVWQPLGVILAIMPWNYPLWQVLRFAAPALMAGNAGLLKHASNVPQSALYLDDLFERGGFPAGSFRTLLIGASEVAKVIEDDRIKAVTLTGSEPAGRSVASIAGQNLKKVVLELGGSDPFIVLPSADLDAASTTAVKARISNNGQSCIAAKRFIVHADVYDAFVDQFAAKMDALVVGDPMNEATDVGPLATEAGRAEVAELVDDAVAKGALVLAGGTALDRPGWYYLPTVLAGLTDDMRIVMEETFGPVATVYRVANNDEAVRVANQTTFGLSSSVWTNSPTEQVWFIDHLDAGAVFINGMTVSYPELPFGGIKDSGYGRELAAAGIREFCNLKTVWKA